MDKLESVYPSTEINWYFELTVADCISDTLFFNTCLNPVHPVRSDFSGLYLDQYLQIG